MATSEKERLRFIIPLVKHGAGLLAAYPKYVSLPGIHAPGQQPFYEFVMN